MNVLDVLKGAKNAAEADAAGEAGAHIELLKQIHQLRLAVETPAEKLMRVRFQFYQNLCIRLAVEFGLLQGVAAKKGRSVTASELAEDSSADELLVVRIMRLVTHLDYCKEIGHGCYAANETMYLITQKGYIGAEKSITDLGFPIGSKLVEIVRGQGLHQFPEHDQESPFQYTFGTSAFEYLEQNQEQKEAFDDYMSVRRANNATQWFDIYPAATQLTDLKQASDGALLVDVGGGKGHEVTKFRDRFQHLPGRLVLQDLPVTVIGLELDGITVMEHNFLTEQPIKGARMYYMSAIMHDWPDNICKAILTRIIPAMDKNYSRILIDDYVLPETNVDVRAAALDILVMTHGAGIERTLSQWQQLLDAAGLEIVNVWSSKTGYESIIEARVRPSDDVSLVEV